MNPRRVSSRRVALTATFLALAAGGAAACDNNSSEGWEHTEEPAYNYYTGTVVEETVTEQEGQEPADEVFYCADEQGAIVDEQYCDDDTGFYFLWHSPSYTRGLGPGARLDGGDYFSPGDAESRRAFQLPTAGRVSNGTVKTNVVGRGSSGPTVGGSSSSGG